MADMRGVCGGTEPGEFGGQNGQRGCGAEGKGHKGEGSIKQCQRPGHGALRALKGLYTLGCEQSHSRQRV